ncbi:MAG: hypothetical protein AAGK22_28840 [Acidobacteriota bacterium]
MTPYWFTLLTLLLAGAAAATDENGNRVDARQLLLASDGNPVTIEISAPQRLVFDATGGDFVLDGRALILRADLVELRGNVVLRSHPATDAEAMTGQEGKDAAPIELAIGEVRPIDGATWTIINDGTDGSAGRRGEQGPTGATGTAGRPRRCGRHAKEPTSGGGGGPGGRGGNGGPGGSGGSAADISVSPNLCSGVAGRVLDFSTRGGRGGAGGEAGLPGAGGPGGKGGFAAWCGPSGDEGSAGPAGQPGSIGRSGNNGTDAKVSKIGGGTCSA